MIRTLLRQIATGFALLGGAVGSAVALLTVASIAGRSLASSPIAGDVELTQFGVALCISLCLPWCQLHGGNIIVDFFTQRAAARTRHRLDGLGAALMALMMGLLAWRTAVGAFSVYESGETTMILGAPMWISYAVLAPGLALSMLIALLQAVAGLRGEPTVAAHP
jgi:TRAP-type C4-dicarboxylate transport system permease small subunit